MFEMFIELIVNHLRNTKTKKKENVHCVLWNAIYPYKELVIPVILQRDKRFYLFSCFICCSGRVQTKIKIN